MALRRPDPPLFFLSPFFRTVRFPHPSRGRPVKKGMRDGGGFSFLLPPPPLVSRWIWVTGCRLGKDRMDRAFPSFPPFLVLVIGVAWVIGKTKGQDGPSPSSLPLPAAATPVAEAGDKGPGPTGARASARDFFFPPPPSPPPPTPPQEGARVRFFP